MATFAIMRCSRVTQKFRNLNILRELELVHDFPVVTVSLAVIQRKQNFSHMLPIFGSKTQASSRSRKDSNSG